MKCKVLLLLILLLPFIANSQNLVPNPSFEEYLACPYSGTEFHSQVVNWYSWQGTPDYFHVCSNDIEGFVGVPINSLGNQFPIMGEAYSGMLNYSHSFTDAREYIACPLIETFEIGESYYVMFYASFYKGGEYVYAHCAIDRLGIRFFQDPPPYTPQEWDNPYEPENTADIEFNELLVDSINWVLIEGWFEADLAYNWMALGNFYDDDHTDTLQLGDPNKCYAYYYVENVCIAKNASDCDYLKQLQDITSTYQVEETNVEVFPNPSSGFFKVSFSSFPNEVEVYDAIGQTMYFSHVLESTLVINSTYWAKGLYILVVKREDGKQQSFKLIKQ
jgi:hypothetical protein